MSETNSKRLKRRSRVDVDETWECTACTYKNPQESFKCEVCYTRKGTSTRKPKLTNSVIQMQEQLEKVFSKDKDEDICKKRKDSVFKVEAEDNKSQFTTYFKKVKGIDRRNFEKFEVTSNGFSVMITEYSNKISSMKNETTAPSGSNLLSNDVKDDKATNNNNSCRNIWSIAMDSVAPLQSGSSKGALNSVKIKKVDHSDNYELDSTPDNMIKDKGN